MYSRRGRGNNLPGPAAPTLRVSLGGSPTGTEDVGAYKRGAMCPFVRSDTYRLAYGQAFCLRVGTGGGPYRMEIRAAQGSSPGAVVYASSYVLGSSLPTVAGWSSFQFGLDVMVPGVDMWVGLSTPNLSVSNYCRLSRGGTSSTVAESVDLVDWSLFTPAAPMLLRLYGYPV